MTAPSAEILDHFASQANACRSLGSPFTAAVVEAVAGLLATDMPVARRIAGWEQDPWADAVALRITGGLHALALTDADAALAACYRDGNTAALSNAVRDAMDTHADRLMDFLDYAPQTNEVGRAAVLAGGFLTIAAATGKSLHLYEIGASAGLNLYWDRWRYRLGTVDWGPADAPLRLSPDWTGPPPPVPSTPADALVLSRQGCDLAPIDLEDPAARLRLRSYVWPDQPERLTRLDAAIETFRAGTVRLARAGAADWVEEAVAAPVSGGVRVLYHSIFWQYVDSQGQERLQSAIMDIGRSATADAPFAWLRYEPASDRRKAALTVTLWPTDQTVYLATAHYHGAWIAWKSATPVPG